MLCAAFTEPSRQRQVLAIISSSIKLLAEQATPTAVSAYSFTIAASLQSPAQFQMVSEAHQP